MKEYVYYFENLTPSEIEVAEEEYNLSTQVYHNTENYVTPLRGNYGDLKWFAQIELGIDIDQNDLVLLSSVSDLGLRYSIRNLFNFDCSAFADFQCTEGLYIGGPECENDKYLFRYIDLNQNVVTTIKKLNLAVKEVSNNFCNLNSCLYLYLMTSPSWNLFHNSPQIGTDHTCLIMSIPHVNHEDIGTVATICSRKASVGATLIIPDEVSDAMNSV